ncbi:MAG: hypothetical protein H3Z52_03975 [archaeon]|nr:hypothetical protein [archaeon]MCP8320089.1 hypothetical protein [archaeon]
MSSKICIYNGYKMKGESSAVPSSSEFMRLRFKCLCSSIQVPEGISAEMLQVLIDNMSECETCGKVPELVME